MRSIFILAIIVVTSSFANAQSHRTMDLFNKGIAASTGGNYETALARFNEVHLRIEREGGSDRFFALTHYNLGVSFYHNRRLAEALEHLDKALRFSKQMYPQAHYLIGLIRFELDDLSGAEKSLRRSIALSADDAEAWYDLAYVYLAEKDNEAAKNAFEKAAKLGASGAAASLNNLGVLLALEGKLADAVLKFEKAAAADRTGVALVNLEKCRRFMDNSSVAGTANEFRFAARRSA